MDTPWELELELALVSQLAKGDDVDDKCIDDEEKNDEEDRAAQLDELTALASIFGDDLSGPAAADAKRAARALEGVLEGIEDDDEDENTREGGLLRFDLDINLDNDSLGNYSENIGTPTRVVLEQGTDLGEQGELLPVGTVVSLPPIRLSVIFPKTYPSSAPPVFALSASWVPRATLDAAASALAEIWIKCPGDAVVFSWVEYLRDIAPNELFTAEVDGERHVRLREQDGWRGGFALSRNATGNKLSVTRGVPNSRSPGDALVVVLRNDLVVRTARYAAAQHVCGVCFADDVLGTNMRRCDGRMCSFEVPSRSQETQSDTDASTSTSTSHQMCTHAFCVECLSTMAKIHVSEGAVGLLKCPEPKCGEGFSPHALKDVLCFGDSSSGLILFQKWEKLILERGLNAMVDSTYCPRCEAHVLEDEDDHVGQCVQCQYAFSTLCREGYHPGTVCLSPAARVEVLEARARGGTRGTAQSDEARRKHMEQVSDAMALRYVEREGKRCPTCGTGVVKSEGCNKMLCGNCEKHFCYKCGEAVLGYEHFQEAGKCSLFDVEAIAAWEREMNVGLVIAEARERDAHVAGLAVHETRCPACRQPNFKLGGNNHIGCWSCGQHYCHTCRVVVRRGADTRAHYGTGAGKCRQHTND